MSDLNATKKAMILYSNCKINLGLNIIARRSDGYHDIETVMIPVHSLYDIVEIVGRNDSDGVVFSSSGIEVDCPPEKNLCIKAYNLIRERYGIGGVAIHLHKRIPFGAGLGGGSSNAAFVIKGLNELFGLYLSIEIMEHLAAELGSDTSFFVRNVPQFAQGRGEILSPCEVDLSGKHLVLVKPDVAVSTAEAYSGVVPGVPKRHIPELLSAEMLCWEGTLVNDFEKTVFTKKTELLHIKNELYKAGAIYASMSGSGSTVYAFFDQKPTLGEWASRLFVHHEIVK